MALVDPDGGGPKTAIDSDGSFVGANSSSLVAPGQSTTYKLLAQHENVFLIENMGAVVASEATGGTASFGLFGAVNVEPFGTDWYRSQVTRMELDLAASAWIGSDVGGWTAVAEPQLDSSGEPRVRTTADGQPIVNYFAVYPTASSSPYYDRTRAGLPILAMRQGTEIVHSDLNGIIAGAPEDGYQIPRRDYPLSYWDNQIANMNSERGREPFREFTAIFHDEIFALQAFDLFGTPAYEHGLHSVRDGFAINYGTAGAGAEIIANRLGVGPMWNCTDCKYEEFFLTSWAIGDPAMPVDVPANQKDAAGNLILGPKATKALYPDDPSNIWDSYLNDRVKFRNVHAGPKEHHVFHLHAHQWQFSPNTKKSSYLDSQLIGPGAGFTYEIAYGGSGNRNKTVGDSIFHCHFYPHFAQGMWGLWRTHDVFERGTKLDENGRPVAGARAYPDGEIKTGTPIPAVVPLPAKPMAPMPNAATGIRPYDLNGDGTADSGQVDADGNGTPDVAEKFATAPAKNPGFPLFVAGVAGHRPPTAPLDMVDVNGDGRVEDGGLPRHVIVGGTARQFQTRLDFDKELLKAKVVYVPEGGTPAEKAAMAFHSTLWQPTFLSTGARVDATTPLTAPGGRPIKGFETNGLPAARGAPIANPCRTDATAGNSWTPAAMSLDRRYKGANIQLNVTYNKLGWHFPQSRILALWDDVGATLTRARAPEPLVMRVDAGECVEYWHTNLVPNVYELDDYQVRTPTDVIGQHIHLVKFDVLSADGSGNGFNYEDGTFSPQEVEERVDAVRAQNGCAGDDRFDTGDTWTSTCPLVRKHPAFGSEPSVGDLAWGARTTSQRWYADPVLNDAWDRGHGSVFTHDHFGPSTHQQVGLYSTVLVEPEGSKWRNPETGAVLGGRGDGGPTSWRADIYWPDGDARNDQAHREFYLEYADFVHAYKAGGGDKRTTDNGAGVAIPTYADFANAVNPSFRQAPPAGHEADIFFFPVGCPDGSPRPCPEAIAADDVGTFTVNYRNEPIGARVFDPATHTQATGAKGDLALAFESRTDRAIAALNTQPTVYPALTGGVEAGDPYTPLLRTYMGDKVRVRAQVGATEEQHNLTIDGLKWRQEPLNLDSGWRNSQAGGISEYFILETPVLPGDAASEDVVDYRYTMGAATDDLWNGNWGLMRSYGERQANLLALPNNPMPAGGWPITNKAQFFRGGLDVACPTTGPDGTATPLRAYQVTAVRAADVLGPNGIVYNDRGQAVTGPTGAQQGAGPLVDPTALMYVYTSDVVFDGAGKPTGLKPGTPIEPLVLRANAGDCIEVELTNALPAVVPDQPGFNALPGIIHKGIVDGGIVTFNANDIRPSSNVGLHPQLLSYSVRRRDGIVAGKNSTYLASPGTSKLYTWYAGDLDWKRAGDGIEFVARPVEFGAVNLMPADLIEGPSKGLGGALVIEPRGATWTPDPTSRMSATVVNGGQSFREFVTVLQDDVNLRYAGGCSPTPGNLECAVPAVGAESGGIPEDSEDAGSKAINYGADPLWFRLGVSPDMPFEATRGNTDVHRVFSNQLVGGDPQTPVFEASPGEAVRFRVLQPGGHARGHVFDIHSDSWQREPYVASSDRLSWNANPDPTTLDGPHDAAAAGYNLTSHWIGAQEGIAASSHFDMLLADAGAQGDHLFRDAASFGAYNGLWGIMRVGPRRTVAITQPAPGAKVSGTAVAVSATASDGIVAVQFKLDGENLGAEDTAAPFELTFDSLGFVDGIHTLSAVGRKADGSATAASPVAVNIANGAIPGGLVAAYSFDEGTGLTTGDSSDQANAGAISGATWVSAGKFGKALAFDGINDWVTVLDSDSIDLKYGLTLEAWVKPSVTQNWPTVIEKEAAPNLSYALYANSDASFSNRPSTHMFVGGYDRNVRGGSTLPVGTWTHLAATYDRVALRLYVNGIQVASLPTSGGIDTSTGLLRIGGNGTWPTEFFNGVIDEVRVYSSALSAAEIQKDMTTPVAGSAPAPPAPPADTSAPTVAITAPANGATVAGSVNVTADAADNVGVVGVQFKVDGVVHGTEDMSSPYGASWDTTTVPDGAHVLTAIARDAAGNSTTSVAVNVTVSNAAPPPPQPPPPPPPPAGGLVAAYSFDEGSGTAAGDSSGAGNGGVVGGATWAVSGKFGGALSFDGVNDWVTVADSALLDLTTGMTLEAWVKPAVTKSWPTVIQKENAPNLAYSLYANSDAGLGNKPSAHIWIGGADRNLRGGTTLPVGTWSHLAATYDGAALRLFVNSLQVAALAQTGSITTSAGALRIGGNSLVANEFFNGLIDEVRIYNRALGPGELATDMNTAVGPAAPSADATAPTVAITAPAGGATLGASVSVTANASDNVGVTGVQFKLDGGNLGAEDTSVPYGVTWDTTAAADGAHVLTAVARDAASNTTTSTAVNVTVSNGTPLPLPPPPGALVAAFSFNGGSGTAAADASGSGNAGLIAGATWSAAGKYGGALSFDGVDDIVTVADAASLDLTTGMTLEAWVKPAVTKSWPTVIEKENAPNLSYGLYANSDAGLGNKPSAHLWIGGVDRNVRGGSTLAVGSWTHLAATYDGAALRVYVNGVEVANLPQTGSIATSTGALRIGGNSVFPNEFFNGLIDEVRIYNRALGAAEVQTDMATGI
jgi:hypothetical protein